MASIGKPGGATRLGKFMSAVLIAVIAVGIAYWWANRPKVASPQVVIPTTSVETTPATRVEVPAVRVESPQAQPAASQPTPQKQTSTVGSDDPYGNLSTKEKK